jgi:hypothetical protein
VYQSQPTSSFPDLAIDSEGILHLAWEEEASGILYTQGTVDGSNIVWEPPYLISDGEGIFEAKHPHILSYGSSTLVSFTNFSSFQQQWIFYTICNTDCSDESDWPGPYGLSSQPLGANTTDPAVINVELSYNGCAYAYYFGTEINGINPENEIVWGVNSCDGWSASLPDQATENATRSIYPAIAVHGTWIQLIYEQVSPSGRHIYVRRGAVEEPPPPGPDGIFLPLIRKK